MKKNKQELILKIGAAGGLLSIWSVTAEDGSRTFLVKRDESTLKEFLDKDDVKDINFKSATGQLQSFNDALTVLGRYPWYKLHPMFVHQDFIDSVIKAVMILGGEREVTRWENRIKFMKKTEDL